VSVETRWLRASGRQVPLLAGPGALAQLPAALDRVGFDGRIFAVVDERAHAMHASALPEVPTLGVSGDEADKSLAQLSRVWDWLVEQEAQRRDAVLAFGGGVVCDLAGFAAATYLRGIGLINAPTTLLAQVDAAVGGKTGINHPRGKNLLGAFYQPLCVVADTSLLATLPARAFAAGMAEVAKMAMILDAELFAGLEGLATTLTAADADAIAPLVARSIELKADIVERDERESGERMLLNYGHTVGHALEAAAGYGALLHGEAVAVGMNAAGLIAAELGLLDRLVAQRQNALLAALRLPLTWRDIATDEVLSRLSVDKKRAGSTQRWILAERIGAACIRADVPAEVVRQAVAAVTLE
jgi:3-dehydroquinate synthase